MLSYQRIGCRHWLHRERGATTDSPTGMRWMQTFRKLPSAAPSPNAVAIITRSIDSIASPVLLSIDSPARHEAELTCCRDQLRVVGIAPRELGMDRSRLVQVAA